MAAAAVDSSYISNYCGIPQPTIDTLIHDPTSDLVATFLQAITVKAREHDKLKAERLRLDVELENAVREAELRARTLKANSEKAVQEVEELRLKLDQEESARASLTVELSSLQSETSNSTIETQSLRDQISRLEKSNRDALGLVDSKTTSNDKLAEELVAQQQKSVGLRREISSFTERLQVAETTLNTARLRESQLRGEIEQLKRNNDWLDSELKTRIAEQTKFRKEKNARIAELQRLNEDSTSSIELLQRTEASLRKRLEESGQKADEAFSRIQQLQEEAVRNEESFRLELDTARRLTDLQKQSAETARRRVQELEDSLEHMKDEAAEEISQTQAEIETERQGRDAAERRVEELEAQVEKLETTAQSTGRAASPARLLVNGLGGPGTPLRSGSPMPFSPGSAKSRGGLSYTQLYTDFTSIKSELETEKRRNEKLTQTLDELIQEMEKKEPEIQESQVEHEHLKAENEELSTLLATTREERDTAKKDGRRWQGAVTGARREADLLNQQLRDLSAQIKLLLVEVQVRSEGSELSATERQELEQLAGVGSGELDGLSDTARFISERLVPYKNIFELQEKNAEMLRIVREIGEAKESEESKTKANTQAQTEAELENLRERVERYKDEMKSLVTQSHSYIRERDMFRRMLSHRGQLPPEADLESMFGNSVNGSTSPRTLQLSRSVGNNEQTLSAKDLSDYSRLLKDLQSQFDAYRRETATDYTTVKEQAAALAKEKMHLQGEVARVNSQLSLAYERYQLLQANFDQSKSESSELRKRAQTLSEVAAKQDLRTQQVAEELVDAKGMTESMRHENANLKAEKDLWKKIEARLSEDNRALSEERSRLNKALTDSQMLFNERELTESETRRRTQNQIDSLEAQLKTLNEKLHKEMDEAKSLSTRREFEVEKHQAQHNDVMKLLNSTKEELSAARTSRDQLQTRLDEMTIELRNAEERIRALQPRVSDSAGQNQIHEATTLSHEQELAIEVADLKRDLELTKTGLEDAQAQVEQYKQISQSAEEELQSLNDVHDQYRTELDQIVSEKDAKIKDLEQRVTEISSELSVSNEQLSSLRSAADETTARLDQQRAQFEEQLVRIKDEAEGYKEAAAFHEGDLKAQAEIAQQAQKNYENELVRHGEATKSLQSVRTELNEIKLEVTQYKADAEAAKATLSQNEDSWSATRDQYERELVELKSRRDDVDAQNKLLHQQLESTSSQIAALQRKRDEVPGDVDSQSSQLSGTQKLQEVINYLRREKEIVDVQYELTVQESKRLRQQLEYTQSQLDDTRVKLDQEQQRQTGKEQSSLNHTKLIDTINELNVFRESSVTLRNEARQAQAQLVEKSKQVDEFVAQLEPLRTSIREITEEKETLQGELTLLGEDRDRWQQRAHNILQKYDRIDPAELEALKEQLSTLQNEREQSTLQVESLQAQVDSIPEQIRVAQDSTRNEVRDRLAEQYKARSRDLSARIKDANTRESAMREQLEAATTDLETLRTARDEALARVEALNTEISALRATKEQNAQDSTREDGQIDEGEVAAKPDVVADLEKRLEAEATKSAEQSAKSAGLQAEVESTRAHALELQGQVEKLERDIASLKPESSATVTTQVSDDSTSQQASEHLEKVVIELAAAQRELEALRLEASTKAAMEGLAVSPSTAAMSEQIEQQIATARADLEKSYAQRTQVLEEHYKTRTNNMKQLLNQKLTDGREQFRNQTAKEHEDALQALRVEHAAAIEKLNVEHSTLVVQIRSAHEQELAKHQGQNATAQNGTKALPEQTNASGVATLIDVPPPAVKAETTNEAEWTPERIKTLLSNNPTVKAILASNIRSKLESETAKLKEQHELAIAKKVEESKAELEKLLAAKVEESKAESAKTLADQLEEAKHRAERTKDQAVQMESKKWNAKVSMAEGRSRTALAKIEYISKTATETPERPVGEVWAVAKDIKPPPPQPSVAVLQSTTTTGTAVAQSPTMRKPSTTAGPTAIGSPAAPSTASPANTVQRHEPVRPTSGDMPAQHAPNGQITATPAPAMPAASAQPAGTPAQPTATPGPLAATSLQQASSMPPPQPSGSAPAGPRGPNQGSGIPRVPGASIRGIARGGRGGLPNQVSAGGHPLPTAPQQQGHQSSEVGQGQTQFQAQRGGATLSALQRGGIARGNSGAGRGSMDPRAGNFMPGNKRPHSPAGTDSGAGKRPRGGPGGGM